MLNKVILNVFLSALPKMLIQFYDSLLKEMINDWVSSTDNELDDSFAKAFEAFINSLR